LEQRLEEVWVIYGSNLIPILVYESSVDLTTKLIGSFLSPCANMDLVIASFGSIGLHCVWLLDYLTTA
jgi:hypothetical protein